MGASKEQFNEFREGDLYDIDNNPIKSSKGILKNYYADITKKSIENEVDRMHALVENAEIDPLKAFCYLKGVAAVSSAAMKKIMPYALNELDLYKGEKVVTVLKGCEVSEMEAGVNYDYSNTDYWNLLNNKVLEAKRELKELEVLLRTFKKPGSIVVDDEVFDVNPPIKTSKTTIKTVFK